MFRTDVSGANVVLGSLTVDKFTPTRSISPWIVMIIIICLLVTVDFRIQSTFRTDYDFSCGAKLGAQSCQFYSSRVP